MPSTTPCPICQQPVSSVEADCGDAAAAPSYAPFCSERCRLVDLQRWMSGSYAVSRGMNFDDIDVLDREPQ